ncbi:MAG: Alcohol dehydrogenase GroES domain protein [Frankiales bacterium]|nr:Alcohol dehydrogenase GroES domain protein [Frankiales bacterium]
MRAVVYDSFGGPLSVREVADPVAPCGGVVVRVEATGVCRSDWHGWQGHDADIQVLPHVPGHELAGTVAEVGPDVQGWSVGDRVTVPFVNACGACNTCAEGNGQVCPHQRQPGFTHWGSFAELVALDAADTNLVALPPSLSSVTAASLGCRFATAYRAVATVAAVQPRERVLVHGAGGVGLSAVQVAVALGATVAVVDPSPAAVALAQSFGAVASIEDPHVTVDAIGDPAAVEASLSLLRPRGRHVQIGLLHGPQPAIPMGRILSKELQLLGSHGMAAHEYPAMLDLVAAGALRPDLLIGRTVGLEDAGQALVDVGKSPGITVVTVS